MEMQTQGVGLFMKSRAPGKSLVLFAPVLLAGCLGMPEGVRPVDGFEPARASTLGFDTGSLVFVDQD
jgi:hypothetical protein